MSVSTVSAVSAVRYFCYVCGGEVQVDSSLHCRQCASEFVEEIETPQRPAPAPTASAVAPPPLIADQIGAIVGSFMNALVQTPQHSVRISAPIAPPVLPWNYAAFRPSGDYVSSNAEMSFVVNQIFSNIRPQNGSPPTPPHVLHSLPVYAPTDDVIAALAGDKVCVICQSELTDAHTDTHADNRIVVLPDCQHYFHRACLMPWLQQHSQCPTCRRTLLAR